MLHDFLSIRLSQSRHLDHRLAQVESEIFWVVFLLNLIFFQLYHSTLNCFRIEIQDCVWFTLYWIISFKWFRPQGLVGFFWVFFSNDFFYFFYLYWICWELNFVIFYLFFTSLSRSHNTSCKFSLLTQVDLNRFSLFLFLFLILYFHIGLANIQALFFFFFHFGLNFFIQVLMIFFLFNSIYLLIWLNVHNLNYRFFYSLKICLCHVNIPPFFNLKKSLVLLAARRRARSGNVLMESRMYNRPELLVKLLRECIFNYLLQRSHALCGASLNFWHTM